MECFNSLRYIEKQGLVFYPRALWHGSGKRLQLQEVCLKEEFSQLASLCKIAIISKAVSKAKKKKSYYLSWEHGLQGFIVNGNQNIVPLYILFQQRTCRADQWTSLPGGIFSMEVEDSSLNGFPFTHSLLRGRCYGLILVWQSVVHARWLLPEEQEPAKAGSRPCQAEAQSKKAELWQKSIPQAIGLPPFTHHSCKNLGHLLLLWSSTGTCHYHNEEILQATICSRVCCLQQPLASFDKDTRHLLLLKGKNQQVSPDLAHLENELVLTSTYILVGRNALQAGSTLLRCSLLAWFASCTSDLPVTTVLLSLCVRMCACMWCEDVPP